jgi:hypothetical protein
MHTPGPWTIVEYGDGDSLAIHDGDSENRICFMATHGGSQKAWSAIQANAKLIAAAPEMDALLAEAADALNLSMKIGDADLGAKISNFRTALQQ